MIDSLHEATRVVALALFIAMLLTWASILAEPRHDTACTACITLQAKEELAAKLYNYYRAYKRRQFRWAV